MLRTAFGVLLVSALLFRVTVAQAQERQKIPQIGFLQRRIAPTAADSDPLADAFRRGLRDLGYVQGKTIQIEHRYAGGRSDRLRDLVAELIRLQVDVIVVASTQAIRTAKQATKTIPIVMITQADPVAEGFVERLARPGGNITGVTRLTRQLSGKRLELLKETLSRISRVGILDGGTNFRANVQDYEAPAHALSIELTPLNTHGPKPDLDAILYSAVKDRVQALIVSRDAVTASYSKTIAELAVKYRLPSMNEDAAYVQAGGLMSYGANDADQFRRAATYVEKILKGVKPADLPVEQPTKFELVINLRTAKQIDLTIPPDVLARADRVIK